MWWIGLGKLLALGKAFASFKPSEAKSSVEARLSVLKNDRTGAVSGKAFEPAKLRLLT